MSKKNRSGILVMLAAGAAIVAIGVSWPSSSPERQPVETTVPALPEKPGVPYIVIKKGDKAPTDMAPPIQLHVYGVTAAECKDMGGTYFAPRTTCLDVDY